MISIRTGTVSGIIKDLKDIQVIELTHDGLFEKAIVYPALTGKTAVGDKVAFNSTAIELDLGTGGHHFVTCNLNRPEHNAGTGGHLMKLRYTPMQAKVLAVDEPDSEYHATLTKACSLEAMPVAAALLHSQIAPIAVAIKNRLASARIAYIMTDGGALPIQYSETVRLLKAKGLIDTTITAGHAFGGDMEALNIYSALLAARHAAKADVAIIAMGPGIAGTSTDFGFTGIEQGQTINAIDSLGGQPVFVARISFADKRERHFGFSRQSIINLKFIARTPLEIYLPFLEKEKLAIIEDQVYSNCLNELHGFYYQEASSAIDELKASQIPMSTMGRGIEQDSEFFMAAWLAGVRAVSIFEDNRNE